jgi:hypothetical protein
MGELRCRIRRSRGSRGRPFSGGVSISTRPYCVRREGGGRHEIADTDPTLINDLRTLAEPATMGDPVRLLTWVSKSLAKR